MTDCCSNCNVLTCWKLTPWTITQQLNITQKTACSCHMLNYFFLCARPGWIFKCWVYWIGMLARSSTDTSGTFWLLVARHEITWLCECLKKVFEWHFWNQVILKLLLTLTIDFFISRVIQACCSVYWVEQLLLRDYVKMSSGANSSWCFKPTHCQWLLLCNLVHC